MYLLPSLVLTNDCSSTKQDVDIFLHVSDSRSGLKWQGEIQPEAAATGIC